MKRYAVVDYNLTLCPFQWRTRLPWATPQSRQSAKLFLQSTELDSPYPSPAGEWLNPQLLLESMYYVVMSTLTKQSGTFPRFLSQDRRLPGAL
jgi:hypothetical protein